MYFAELKLGETAKQELQEKAPRIKEQLKYWPGPVVQFYLGSLTSAQVVAAAKADDLMDKNPCICDDAHATEMKVRSHDSEGAAYFYLAEDMLLRGRTQEARPLLQKAVSLAAKNSQEYHGAVVELSRMLSDALRTSVSK
jgi:lipoprotein NlpI